MAGGIAFAAMQFILHCYPKKIYIVGCDCTSGFFYDSKITFECQKMVEGWLALKEHIDELYPDIEIVSLNPVGLRGLFKDEYSQNYLDSLSDDEKGVITIE